MKSTDDSFIKQVTAGYISEDGEPIKCECGCTEFKRVNMYFEEGYLVEYTLECINEKSFFRISRSSKNIKSIYCI